MSHQARTSRAADVVSPEQREDTASQPTSSPRPKKQISPAQCLKSGILNGNNHLEAIVTPEKQRGSLLHVQNVTPEPHEVLQLWSA